jgi:uncharacterized membrane protein YhhN
MSKNLWILFFVAALSANLLGITLMNETLQAISKPFIVLALAGYFITATTGTIKVFRLWVLLALFFSWAGDILLIFQGKKDIFFILGLSAFLLAHIFYILFFNLARMRENIAGRWWLLLIVLVYYSLLIALLSPYLEDKKIPVKVYAVVVNFMFMLAMHLYFLRNKKAGLLIMFGAMSFIISDSLLAINKFYFSFEPAGFIIMLTYALAQWMIIEGSVRYLNSIPKQ